MIIELNIDLLRKHENSITITEFLCLNLIYNEVNPEEFCSIHVINDLQNKLYIIKTNSGYELRDKGRGIVLSDDKRVVNFDQFFDKYHLVCKLRKTDKEAAKKHFKTLKNSEKLAAFNNIEKYYNSISDKRYVHKARTYLSNKLFNDEFEEVRSNESSIFSIAE